LLSFIWLSPIVTFYHFIQNSLVWLSHLFCCKFVFCLMLVKDRKVFQAYLPCGWMEDWLLRETDKGSRVNDCFIFVSKKLHPFGASAPCRYISSIRWARHVWSESRQAGLCLAERKCESGVNKIDRKNSEHTYDFWMFTCDSALFVRWYEFSSAVALSENYVYYMFSRMNTQFLLHWVQFRDRLLAHVIG